MKLRTHTDQNYLRIKRQLLIFPFYYNSKYAMVGVAARLHPFLQLPGRLQPARPQARGSVLNLPLIQSHPAPSYVGTLYPVLKSIISKQLTRKGKSFQAKEVEEQGK